MSDEYKKEYYEFLNYAAAIKELELFNGYTKERAADVLAGQIKTTADAIAFGLGLAASFAAPGLATVILTSAGFAVDAGTTAFCYAIGDDEEAQQRIVAMAMDGAFESLGAVSKYADDVADLTDDTFGSVYKKKIASESSEYVDDITKYADEVVDIADDKITSFADLMTPEEAARYNEYWDNLGNLKSTTIADDLVDDVTKYADEVAEIVDDAVESGNDSALVSKLTSADVKAAIEKNGMSVEDFSKLLDPNRTLTPDELKFVDRVRTDIGLPETGTVMNKIVPQSDIYNYLYNENYNGVRGFVSVDEHSNILKTLDDVFEGNRLDYDNTAFKIGNGVDGISKSVGNADTVYGKITYVLDDATGIKIPKDLQIATNAPYTGRGFTGSKNVVLPELVQDTRPFVDGDILGIYDAKTGELTQQFVYDSDLGWLLK